MKSSLIRVYPVCNSVYIFWKHYSNVKPSCSFYSVKAMTFNPFWDRDHCFNWIKCYQELFLKILKHQKYKIDAMDFFSNQAIIPILIDRSAFEPVCSFEAFWLVAIVQLTKFLSIFCIWHLIRCLIKLTSLNCTRPSSPSSDTHAYAASDCKNSWHSVISSLRNKLPILAVSLVLPSI